MNRPTCGICPLFRALTRECFGLPPKPVGITADGSVISARPSVLPNDTACVLYLVLESLQPDDDDDTNITLDVEANHDGN